MCLSKWFLVMNMGVELILAGVSCLVSVMSVVGTAGMWVSYIRRSKGVITLVRVDKTGNVQVSDLISGLMGRS